MGIVYVQILFEVELDICDDCKVGIVIFMLCNLLGYEICYSIDGSVVMLQLLCYSMFLQQLLLVVLQVVVFFDGKVLVCVVSGFDIIVVLLFSCIDEYLVLCLGEGKLLLWLEDDGLVDGVWVIFNVNIFNLCWFWQDVDLDGIVCLCVCVGQILYYFQFVYDELQC